MSNELTLTNENFLKLSGNGGSVDLVKPLLNKIHLFDTYVAGTTYLEDTSVLKTIKVGDELLLSQEDNRYDHNAILISTLKNQKLGYIPRKDNIIFSRLMSAGKKLIAKITDIKEKGSFTEISIGIYLVDY